MASQTPAQISAFSRGPMVLACPAARMSLLTQEREQALKDAWHCR